VFSRGCLNFSLSFVGGRENLKGDFFSCICANEREMYEKALEEREKRNGTLDDKLRLSNVRFDRIRRDFGKCAFARGWFLAGAFARGFFLFFLSLLSSRG